MKSGEVLRPLAWAAEKPKKKRGKKAKATEEL